MVGRASWVAAAAAAAMVVACGTPDDATPIGGESLTKVLVEDPDVEIGTIDGLVDVIDYGTFRLALVNAAPDSVAAVGVVRDDMNWLWLDGLPLDTRRPDSIDAALPPHLLRHELRDAAAQSRAPRDGLYIVQMIG